MLAGLHQTKARRAQMLGLKVHRDHFVKKTGLYPAQLRVKVNTTGAAKVRYWDAARARTNAPLDHSGLTYTARVELRAVWASGESWGLVAVCTDLLQQEVAPVHCPF